MATETEHREQNRSLASRLFRRGPARDDGATSATGALGTMGATPYPVPVAPPARAVTGEEQARGAEAAAREAASDEERVYVAPPWKLAWWKFLRHRVAVVSAGVIALLYLVALLAEFIAPYGPNDMNARLTYAPPTPLRFVDAEGRFTLRPHVYGLKQTIEPVALRRVFTVDTTKLYPVSLFVQGEPYKLAGLVTWDRHLFGAGDPEAVVLLAGADKLGQDVFSRTVHGARISLTISLVSVALQLALGIVLGGVSGYYGGSLDNAIQRVVEVLRSFPHLPLYIALSAAVPKNWTVLQTYFAVTLVIATLGWTGLARVVRGRFLALREEDFVTAARLAGSGERRIIFRHMLPSFASHIIASTTLAIPGAIIAETSLSFLGVGMRPPAVSWGVLLQDAQNVRAVASAPWLMLPALGVIVAVLAFNFFGDGLRDAADPYTR